jgi:hypothetical protein
LTFDFMKSSWPLPTRTPGWTKVAGAALAIVVFGRGAAPAAGVVMEVTARAAAPMTATAVVRMRLSTWNSSLATGQGDGERSRLRVSMTAHPTQLDKFPSSYLGKFPNI